MKCHENIKVCRFRTCADSWTYRKKCSVEEGIPSTRWTTAARTGYCCVWFVTKKKRVFVTAISSLQYEFHLRTIGVSIVTVQDSTIFFSSLSNRSDCVIVLLIVFAGVGNKWGRIALMNCNFSANNIVLWFHQSKNSADVFNIFSVSSPDAQKYNAACTSVNAVFLNSLATSLISLSSFSTDRLIQIKLSGFQDEKVFVSTVMSLLKTE